MMRVTIILGIVLLMWASRLAAAGKIAVNASTLSAHLPSGRSEFVVSLPMYLFSEKRGWQYIVQYAHSEPDAELGFEWTVVSEKNSYILAIYSDTFASFYEKRDAADQEEKLRLADHTKVMDLDFVQVLYETWISVLLRVRYGDAELTSTGSESYYLSAYTLQAGPMSGSAPKYRKGATTGQVVEIGLLLKQWGETSDAQKAKQLEEKIRTLCANLQEKRGGFWSRFFAS